MPEREHLGPNDRQLLSMETCEWLYHSVTARWSGLNFVSAGAWSRVQFTWLPDGRFDHWYVNFQQPMTRFDGGYESMDLVLDMVIDLEGTPRWKDRDHFDAALARGIIPAHAREAIEAEARRVLDLLDRRAGPFDPAWATWRPPAEWPLPVLPATFADGLKTPPGTVANGI
jgi:predicted RNA-binding protein associated with RNAse of E/G family